MTKQIAEPYHQLNLFSAMKSVEPITIDSGFDVDLANKLAEIESYNKHLYRPNTYLHKWWARRCGTTFRLILKHLVTQSDQRSFYAPGGLEGKVILDPMMGGGTTLHEAIRLGANVVGVDIDPIPVLQARASLSSIDLFRLERAFTKFYDPLRHDLAPLYRTACPVCGKTVESQYMLYGLEKSCSCSTAIFVDSYLLRHNPDGSVFHLDPYEQHILLDGRIFSPADRSHALRLLEKTTRQCEKCHMHFEEDIQRTYYQRYVPIAVFGTCDVDGVFFSSPQEADLGHIKHANAYREKLDFDPANFKIEEGPKSTDLIRRGIVSYLDLFSSRQLLFLHWSSSLVRTNDPLERLNLGLLVSTSLEFNSMLCGYKGAGKNRPGAVRHTFAHHAYSFPHTALESNPVYSEKASGNLQNLFHQRIRRARQWALRPEERLVENGRVRKVKIEGELDIGEEVKNASELRTGSRKFLLIQGSATRLPLDDKSVDFVVTDPPYFDSVQYSDLAAFFRVWLRTLLESDAVWTYDHFESAVNQHESDDEQYTSVMTGIFAECRRVLHENGRLIFTFHHWNPKGWAALTLALKRAGFFLTNRYVVHSENPVSVHIANLNALTHDAILVCAPEKADVEIDWQAPEHICTDDSRDFTEQCADLLGHLLMSEYSADEIRTQWSRLLPV